VRGFSSFTVTLLPFHTRLLEQERMKGEGLDEPVFPAQSKGMEFTQNL
jgi:hypothetical protein